MISKLMAGYLMFALILYVIGFFVYLARYQKARRGLIIYNRNLKALIKLEAKKKKRKSNVVKTSAIGGDIEGLDSAFSETGRDDK